MVSIELSRIDCRRLMRIMLSDKKEYQEGIKTLERLKEEDPNQKVGKLRQTPEEAIKTTKEAIEAIDRLMQQMREHK